MQKVLSQPEIDALVRAARGGGKIEERASGPRIERWDARRAGQIGREQLHAITVLHEGFARSLTHSLGAYLRIVFSATLVSAENLAYREFLQRIPETTYLASCRLDPIGVVAAMQLDLKVAFPIIDLLLLKPDWSPPQLHPAFAPPSGRSGVQRTPQSEGYSVRPRLGSSHLPLADCHFRGSLRGIPSYWG